MKFKDILKKHVKERLQYGFLVKILSCKNFQNFDCYLTYKQELPVFEKIDIETNKLIRQYGGLLVEKERKFYNDICNEFYDRKVYDYDLIGNGIIEVVLEHNKNDIDIEA